MTNRILRSRWARGGLLATVLATLAGAAVAVAAPAEAAIVNSNGPTCMAARARPKTYITDRETACYFEAVRVEKQDAVTRRPLGSADLEFTLYAYASRDARVWAHQVEITTKRIDATVADATITGQPSCQGTRGFVDNCVPINGQAQQTRPLLLGQTVAMEVDWGTAATQAGQRAYGTSRWGFRVDSPTAENDPGFRYEFDPGTPEFRCDTAIPGNPTTGCVVPSFQPTLPYSRSISPELANHIGYAQASGLPGAPADRPLHRLAPGAQADANRNRACPSYYNSFRPAGKTCDEYPFKSTQEGAAQNPQGQGRTFDFCGPIPLQRGVRSPTGYSACFIAGDENSQDGGSLLNSFYIDNRILPNDANNPQGDAFRIAVVS